MNAQTIISAAVVALVTSFLAFAALTTTGAPASSLAIGTEQDLGSIKGTVIEQPYVFKSGVGSGGDTLTFTKDGVISAGQNQGSFRNTTGRTVYVDLATIGYESGTASSSLLFYAGTSTTATFSNDFASPSGAGKFFPIDAAVIATSTTGLRIITSTSTPSGNGSVAVANGQYFVFQVQERYACKSVGVCETATSTNRGISNFLWYVRGHYKP